MRCSMFTDSNVNLIHIKLVVGFIYLIIIFLKIKIELEMGTDENRRKKI